MYENKILSLFNLKSRQGYIGLLENNVDKSQKIFKLSKYIDNIIEHEKNIGKSINELNKVSFHYCNYFLDINKSAIDFNLIGNSFDKEILILENLDKNNYTTFYNQIKNKKFDINNTIYITKQILSNIYISQVLKKLTHYDLHSKNIINHHCDNNILVLYIFDEDNQLLVPVNNNLCKIIDFGNSYSEDIDNKFLNGSLNFTDKGFTFYEFDKYSDVKLYLNSVLYDLRLHKKMSESKFILKFKNFVRQIFKPLKIDKSSGWDIYNRQNILSEISDTIIENLTKINDDSILFENIYFSLELIQNNIQLPFKKSNYKNIKSNYINFYKEFYKIETFINRNKNKWIDNKLLCRKSIDDIFGDTNKKDKETNIDIEKNKNEINEKNEDFILNVKLYYLKKIINVTRYHYNTYFKYIGKKNKKIQILSDIIDKIKKKIIIFKYIDEIDFKNMIESLLLFTKNLEGYFFHLSVLRKKHKNKLYRKLKFDSILELIYLFEYHFPSKFNFESKNKILISDLVNRKKHVINNFIFSNQDLEFFKNYNSIYWGNYLYLKINKPEQK